MSEYRWKDGARFRVKAQVVGERLESLVATNGGSVTPAMVVDDARPEDSPTHPLFEWNDSVAGELYREEQARNVIRSVRVIADVGTEDQRPSLAYVSVKIPDEGNAYITTARMASDAELRQLAIEDAIAGLGAWRKRYEHIAELAESLAAVDRAIRAAQKAAKRRKPAPEPHHVTAHAV